MLLEIQQEKAYRESLAAIKTIRFDVDPLALDDIVFPRLFMPDNHLH
jgi:hypothetical protein